MNDEEDQKENKIFLYRIKMISLFVILLFIGIVLIMKFSKPKNTQYKMIYPPYISKGSRSQSDRSRLFAEAAMSRDNPSQIILPYISKGSRSQSDRSRLFAEAAMSRQTY